MAVNQLYSANGVTASFAIPFSFIDGDAPNVTQVFFVDPVSGARTPKTISTDYTLPALLGAQPVNVVFNTAPPTTVKVLIERVLPYTQIVSYINTGQFLAKTHETGLDRLDLQIQQIGERLSRTPMLNILDKASGIPSEIAPGAAGTFLGINPTKTGFWWVSAATVLSFLNPEMILPLLNNVGATAIAGLQFSGSVVRSFKVDFTIFRSAVGGQTRAQRVTIIGVYTGSGWQYSQGESTETDAGVTFTVDSGGQLYYATDDNGGAYSALNSTLHYKTIDTMAV